MACKKASLKRSTFNNLLSFNISWT